MPAINFQYAPTSGALSGVSFEEQTERAFNELGKEISDIEGTSDEALGVANTALSTAQDAVNVATEALETAQSALDAASSAGDGAHAAMQAADEALAKANDAINTAGSALTAANDALAQSETSFSTASEALAQSTNALNTAEQALIQAARAEALAQEAAGIYAVNTEAMDLNDFFATPNKLYVRNPAVLNAPVQAPFWLEVALNSDNSSVLQIITPESQNGSVFRVGAVSSILPDGADAIQLDATPDSGTSRSFTLTITSSSTSGLSGSALPGSFTAIDDPLAGVTVIGGSLALPLAGFSGGVFVGASRVAYIDENGSIAIDAANVATDKGIITFVAAQYVSGIATLEISYTWGDVSEASVTWGQWHSSGAANPAQPNGTPGIVSAGAGLSVTSQGELSVDYSGGGAGILLPSNGGTGNATGNAATATALATGRTIRTNLASTVAPTFNGTANITPGVTGILPAINGGTGRSTGAAPLPQAAAGVGQQVEIQSYSGAASYALPAGGTWTYWCFEFGAGGTVGIAFTTYHMGLASGGTAIAKSGAANGMWGVAWRIA